MTQDLDAARLGGADSSTMSETVSSEMIEEASARQPAAAPAVRGLPLIGALSTVSQQRALGGALLAGLVGLVLVTLAAFNAASEGASQTAATGEAQIQSQRLAKAVSQALTGSAEAFPEVKGSAAGLVAAAKDLQAGNALPSATTAAALPALAPLLPLIDKAEKNAATVLAQQAAVTQVGSARRAINRQSGDLLELAETVAAAKLQQGASGPELSAANQLVMLTQRIAKFANELLVFEGAAPESVLLLGRDLGSFRDTAESLLNGNAELRLPGTKDAAARQQIQNLTALFEKTRTEAALILDNLQGLEKAREAQSQIVADSEPLRIGLQKVQTEWGARSGLGPLLTAIGALSTLLAVGGALGFFMLDARNQRGRAALAELQRGEAERLEQQAKRFNDANQAAILRLMNELQTVAEGDLTQQATVTEDITGAIADSVNYTVEELRRLVFQVQGTVARVTDTTQQVEITSIELLAASDEQLREIRETGEAVLQMAGRINGVSAQAAQSALVARQSLVAAESGLQAVENAIGGMNTLRDQIQDTSKRIKRLGESSQEIGEITELISDITEQTNVLALNAAIQAASAGEAGRGFSVVAEEVQRLAERSGDATRQIAALVKAIQTDTQDAVAAMERSTQGVVEGARLSDSAGAALGEIDRITSQLAELIESISSETSGEARSANVVATNIQHIFAVTAQTGEGTRSTADLVRELSRTANELRASVARFKID